MLKITSSIATPVSVQQRIADVTGEKFHITYVRKIMHQYGMFAKTAQKCHINHASTASVRNWQQYMKKKISRLKKNGFTIAMLDEAFFVRDVKAGRKYWSLVTKRIFLPHVGKHENFAVYGTMLENGNQMFRIYKKFNSVTFVKYLKELQYRYGKISIMLDRASVHIKKSQRISNRQFQCQINLVAKGITIFEHDQTVLED